MSLSQSPLKDQCSLESSSQEPEPDDRQRVPGPSKKCNCRRSKCIKLYCECYQAKVFCDSSCHCQKCQNNIQNEPSRSVAMRSTLEKNPTAFQPKIANDNQIQDPLTFGKHNKGCACRKSGCMKKYCECFQAKVPCSEICKCTGCRNHGYLTREHFLKSTNSNEDSSQQNFLYQLLLAKDGDHLQSLMNEQSLFNNMTKPLFNVGEIEDLCSKMVEIARMPDLKIEQIMPDKKIKIEQKSQAQNTNNFVEQNKQNNQQDSNNNVLMYENYKIVEQEYNDQNSSGSSQIQQNVNDVKRYLILELFLSQLRQAEQ